MSAKKIYERRCMYFGMSTDLWWSNQPNRSAAVVIKDIKRVFKFEYRCLFKKRYIYPFVWLKISRAKESFLYFKLLWCFFCLLFFFYLGNLTVSSNVFWSRSFGKISTVSVVVSPLEKISSTLFVENSLEKSTNDFNMFFFMFCTKTILHK